MNSNREIAVFGGGCFWCTEAVFQRVRGVVSVQSGYAGGNTNNPTDEEVYSGRTNHAEVLKIEFDPSIIAYDELLDIFFHTHDPTTLNQQGADVGTQYRSIILTTTDEQNEFATKAIQRLADSKEFSAPIVTQVQPLKEFFNAEDYHANYYTNNENAPYCQLVIAPKLQKFLEKYKDKAK